MLGFLYGIAFLIILNQYIPLVGERGLLPAPIWISHIPFSASPSIFYGYFSDSLVTVLAVIGLLLSAMAMLGLSENFGMAVSAGIWFVLWGIYLSFVNVGQTFYGFGWEMLLLETGFLAIFLGDRRSPPPKVIFWLYRWLLFRVMFGAGMIKLRGDECWRNFTCMNYHYETQPIPNPLSWYFHHLPSTYHQLEVLGTHIIELVVPWGLLVPGPVGAACGVITALFQCLLILSGNLSWLNYMTLLLCLSCFDDELLSRWTKLKICSAPPMSMARKIIIGLVTAWVLSLSIKPAINLFSTRQMMNASFDPLHLVNTYGAFGSITRQRHEVLIEGAEDTVLTPLTEWKAYEFKGKPGHPSRRPAWVSPYHWKLDWQMWFAAMSSYPDHPWIINLIAKLLKNDRDTLRLLDHNPFPDNPPLWIRAELYRYEFTSPEEKRRTGQWWRRSRISSYLPPLSLSDPRLQAILKEQGWDD